MRRSSRPLLCGLALLAATAGLPVIGAQASARHGRTNPIRVSLMTHGGAATPVSGKVGRYVIPNGSKPQSEWVCNYDRTSLRWTDFGMPNSVLPRVAMRPYWHRRGWPAQNVALYVLYQGKRGSVWRTWKYTELIKEIRYGKAKKPRLTGFLGHHVRTRTKLSDKWWSRNATSYRVVVELAWLRPTHGSPVEGTVREIITHYRSGQASLGRGVTCPRLIPAPPPVCTGNCAVMAWGENSDGTLGDGKSSPASTGVPVKVSGLTSVTTIGAGGTDGYAVVNGAAYAWGSDSSGGLGNGKTSGSSDVRVKVGIPSSETVVAVTGGAAGNGYARTQSGHVYAWGDNSEGQLGNGSAGGQSGTPALVPDLGDVVAIAAGQGTAYAMNSLGDVYAWGDNSDGQLGMDPVATGTHSANPVLVPLSSSATGLAASGSAAYALTGSGVWAWGNNEDGQLGDGSDTSTELSSATPVPVALPTGIGTVTGLAGGGNDGYALSSGNVYAWGDNGDGELGAGDGVGSQSSTPVSTNLSNARWIAAGSQDGYAVTTTGTVVAWGSNTGGALGQGNASGGSSSDVPVTVVGLSHVTGIAAGTLFAYAMTTS